MLLLTFIVKIESEPLAYIYSSAFLFKGLQVVRCPRSASVTRRAAGLPMLILCVLSAEEASKARPLLASSMEALMDTAQTPLEKNWDQTLDLPQVSEHTCNIRIVLVLVLNSDTWSFLCRCVRFTLCRRWCVEQVWEQRSYRSHLPSSSCLSLCSVLPAGP